MDIVYRDTHSINKHALERLFLSLAWSSGHYPEKLEVAMKNYNTVYSAWCGEQLVGLLSAMDDGVMTAYIHYLLIHPDFQGQGIGKKLMEMAKQKYADYLRIVLIAYDKARPFYERCGFEIGEEETPMFITSLWT